MLFFENLEFINHHIYNNIQHCIIEWENGMYLTLMGGIELDQFGFQNFYVGSNYVIEDEEEGPFQKEEIFLNFYEVDEILIHFIDEFGYPITINKVKFHAP